MKIEHKTMVDQVVEALLEWIEREDLRPGDALPSTARLVTEFGASRPVVRESLKVLEGRGIIETGNGRRAVIRPVSSDVLQSYFQRAVSIDDEHLLQILEVRHGIEVQAARLAAQRRSDKELARLRDLSAEMRAALYDSEVYTALDLDFHLQIAALAQNDMLFYLVESIRDVLRDTIRQGLRHRLTRDERLLVQSTHEDIVEKIAAQDGEGAALAMAFHFNDAIRAIFYPEDTEQDSVPAS